MSNNILSDEKKEEIIKAALNEYEVHGTRIAMNTVDMTVQAVLQSPEIQQLRKDAERYRWLREDENRYDAERWMCDKSPSSLDSSIDAAIEVKT